MRNAPSTLAFIAAISVAGGVGAVSVFAGDDTADITGTQIAACRVLTGDSARLACYDRLADRIMSQNSIQQVPAKKAPGRGPVQPTNQLAATSESTRQPENERAIPRDVKTNRTTSETRKSVEDNFGAEDVENRRKERAEKRVNEIAVTVVKLAFSLRGQARYTLSNGQVWEQTDRMKVRRYKAPYTAILKRAAMGSYKMNKEGSGVSTRVKRIK